MSATTAGGVSDTTDPSAPASLLAVDTAADAGGSIDLSWSAATDDVAVTGYKLYRGTAAGVYGAPVALGNVTSYTDATAATGTRYYYAVSAVDAAGNEGRKSPEASAIAVDNAAPAVPSGLSAVGGTTQVAALLDRQLRVRPRRLRPVPRRRQGQHDPDHRHDLHRHRTRRRPRPTPTRSRPSTPTATPRRDARSVPTSATTSGTAPFDGTFESGADGAALTPAWTLSGTPQRAEYDTARAKNGTMSGLDPGPDRRRLPPASRDGSARMTSNGAEFRFWMYCDTTNEYRYVDDYAARSSAPAPARIRQRRVTSTPSAPATGYTTGAYTAVGTYATGWTEYRVVYDFTTEHLHAVQARERHATPGRSSRPPARPRYAIPMREATDRTTTARHCCAAATRNAHLWVDDVRYSDTGITDASGAHSRSPPARVLAARSHRRVPRRSPPVPTRRRSRSRRPPATSSPTCSSTASRSGP